MVLLIETMDGIHLSTTEDKSEGAVTAPLETTVVAMVPLLPIVFDTATFG